MVGKREVPSNSSLSTAPWGILLGTPWVGLFALVYLEMA